MERIYDIDKVFNGREPLEYLISDAEEIISEIERFMEYRKIKANIKFSILIENGCIGIEFTGDDRTQLGFICIGRISNGVKRYPRKISLFAGSVKKTDIKIAFEIYIDTEWDEENCSDTIIVLGLEFDSYLDYLKSDYWKEFRAYVKNIYGNKCMMCGNSNTELHVHHNNYRNLFNENLKDVIVLCKDCHEKFHDIKEGDN